MTVTQQRGAITGAGGKGGGGGQELPDSIRSTQMADIVDLISEGEIEGLINGLGSIYLDGVALENPDGSRNFEGVTVVTTAGTQGQASITGADGVQSEQGVGVNVLAATPVVRSITNPDVDTVRVTISVPQLTSQNADNGDLGGSSFEWAVDVQSAGGGFVQQFTDTVEGKTTSRYTRSKQFALPGSAPWDIRVRRVTADSTSQLVVNAFGWSSFTEIQSLKLRMPNSALARLRVNAQQFGRIPVRAYHVRGIRVRVPTNYDPLTKVYTGVWDGTFKVAWTDCPAWIYYDLVTHNRYGLGRYFQVTPALKWTMYTIGRYCDEMVPDGRGGMEPRFKCGVYLTTREQAYKVLSDLAAIFRGMAYWAGTDLGVTQDAPADPVALFTNANVVDGKFSYTGASASRRHNQITVWWNSMAEFGKLVPETLPIPELQKRTGLKPLELSPLGVWSRGQAQRLAKWVRYSEDREGTLESHRVGMDGALVAPGLIYQVADANEAGERLGGRVRSATTAAVTLDAPVTLVAGESYELSVMVQDPANAARLMVVKRPVTNGAGLASVLNLFPELPSAPAAQTVWLLQSTGVAATSWRCLSVAEVAGQNQYEITGIRHDPGKYALIEQGIAFEPRHVSRITSVPPAPASIAFTETIYALGQERRSRVTLSWPEPAKGLAFLLSWRLANGPWNDMPATTENCVDVDALAPGLLEVRVKSRNALGNLSKPLADAFTVQGNQVVVGGNLIDPSWWRPGAAWEWETVFDASGENDIVWGTGPKGTVQALWRATAQGVPFMGPDGGWSSNLFGSFPKNVARVQPQRTYRFALPVMRVSGTGPVYFGPGYQDALAPEFHRVCLLNGAAFADNPYFWSGALPTQGKWYLLVAYVYPAGSTGVPTDAGGLFDLATGEKVGSVANFCWLPDARDVSTRAFQYYNSAGAQALFAPPTVEVVDGTDGAWQAGPRGLTGASSITLVASGNCTTPGPDRIRKATGVTDWDSDCRSLESFTGGAWCSFQCEQNNKNLMLGLNSDPAAGVDYTNLDYAWFCSEGQAHIYESGAYVLTLGAYTTDTVFSVQYDNDLVRYFANGVQVRQVAAAAGLRLYLDSAFMAVGAEVRNVRFGPAGAAGADGAPGQDARLLTLLASAQAFTFNGAGSAQPLAQTINLSALLANLAGTASWTATGFDSTGASLGALTLGGSGNNRTLSIAAFGASAYAVVSASSGAYSDHLTIVRLRDGTPGVDGRDAITGYLTNEAHTVATAVDGSGGSYASAGGDFKVFDGLAELTSGVVFSVAAVSGITGMAIGADGVYSLAGCAGSGGTATLRAVVGTVTIDKVYTLSKSLQGNPGADGSDGTDGTDGTNGVSVFTATVYAQGTSEPAAPTGGFFNFATGELTAPAGWTTERPAFNRLAATWSVRQGFATSVPGATVAGGLWNSVTRLDNGAAASAVDGFGGHANKVLVGSGTTSAAASITLRSDGQLERVVTGLSPVIFGNWYLPTTAGIGASFNLVATGTGDALFDPTVLNAERSLTSGLSFTLQQSGSSYGEKMAAIAASIVRVATGVVEGRGTISLYAAREP